MRSRRGRSTPFCSGQCLVNGASDPDSVSRPSTSKPRSPRGTLRRRFVHQDDGRHPGTVVTSSKARRHDPGLGHTACHRILVAPHEADRPADRSDRRQAAGCAGCKPARTPSTPSGTPTANSCAKIARDGRAMLPAVRRGEYHPRPSSDVGQPAGAPPCRPWPSPRVSSRLRFHHGAGSPIEADRRARIHPVRDQRQRCDALGCGESQQRKRPHRPSNGRRYARRTMSAAVEFRHERRGRRPFGGPIAGKGPANGHAPADRRRACACIGVANSIGCRSRPHLGAATEAVQEGQRRLLSAMPRSPDHRARLRRAAAPAAGEFNPASDVRSRGRRALVEIRFGIGRSDAGAPACRRRAPRRALRRNPRSCRPFAQSRPSPSAKCGEVRVRQCRGGRATGIMALLMHTDGAVLAVVEDQDEDVRRRPERRWKTPAPSSGSTRRRQSRRRCDRAGAAWPATAAGRP